MTACTVTHWVTFAVGMFVGAALLLLLFAMLASNEQVLDARHMDRWS